MLKRPNLKRHDMVLVGTTWYFVEEMNADGTIWASDDDGQHIEISWEIVDAYKPYKHIIDYS